MKERAAELLRQMRDVFKDPTLAVEMTMESATTYCDEKYLALIEQALTRESKLAEAERKVGMTAKEFLDSKGWHYGPAETWILYLMAEYAAYRLSENAERRFCPNGFRSHACFNGLCSVCGDPAVSEFPTAQPTPEK